MNKINSTTIGVNIWDDYFDTQPTDFYLTTLKTGYNVDLMSNDEYNIIINQLFNTINKTVLELDTSIKLELYNPKYLFNKQYIRVYNLTHINRVKLVKILNTQNIIINNHPVYFISES